MVSKSKIALFLGGALFGSAGVRILLGIDCMTDLFQEETIGK